MIILTKLNGTPFTLNCDHIETIEEHPDTTITVSDGNYYIVKEPMVDVISKVIEYKRKIHIA